MKRRLFVLLVLALMCGLASCDGDGPPSANTGENILPSAALPSASETAPPPSPVPPPTPEQTPDAWVTIDMGGGRTPISPYIYGVNDCFSDADYGKFTANALRQGGNRYSGYNWENNFSSAGSDWQHYNDDYLVMDYTGEMKTTPGAPALNLSNLAQKNNIPYTAVTLQMAGYAAADDGRTVEEGETAPSARWKAVAAKKNAPFSLTPDLADGYVYMDEYVNYLVGKLGDSTKPAGINGYLLDNEPALWSHTHPRIHPEPLGVRELVDKSAEWAAAVKAVDPNADVIGPVLYGFNAYVSLQDAPDWNETKGGHDWFVTYYLEEMAKAGEANGQRLLDVLDVHYYSEARGAHRASDCADVACQPCIEARMQAPRTLWDASYVNKLHDWSGNIDGGEDSWINQWNWAYLPLLPRLRDDIAKFYPGTKLGITEYNFGGGNHISGAIAQVDALGAFAENGVYLATYWPLGGDNDYVFAGLNLYTNYDGQGSSFGGDSVPAESSDTEKITAYAAAGGDDTRLTLTATNKNGGELKTRVTIERGGHQYQTAEVYAVVDGSAAITKLGDYPVSGNQLDLTLPAMSAAMIVIS